MKTPCRASWAAWRRIVSRSKDMGNPVAGSMTPARWEYNVAAFRGPGMGVWERGLGAVRATNGPHYLFPGRNDPVV
jgi:hypothetical protein